jgi:hypothetical protein
MASRFRDSPAAIFVFVFLICGNFSGVDAGPQELSWYRGNTHTHSLWSDGNDFPEMIAAWYKDKGYHFMALSDHNILARGEKWMSEAAIRKRQRALGRSAIDKYVARFGEEWVVRREGSGGPEIRLRTLEEYRGKLEESGAFLLVEAEEVSAQFEKVPIHLNAVNIQELHMPLPGDSVEDVIRKNLQALAEQEGATGKPILVHLNHPNFKWAVSAEVLARVVEERFFEVYNGHPVINHMGSATKPSDEQIWDIANTIRLGELGAAPLFGVATDDSHTYHGGDVRPGRGWVMVQAERLEADELVRAMRNGQFYASTGVFLDSVAYDEKARELKIAIRPEEGANFITELTGTLRGYDATAAGGDTGIGAVLATAEGTEISFQVPEDALYARATITSSRPHEDPSFRGQFQQAWTQPVAWRSLIASGGIRAE